MATSKAQNAPANGNANVKSNGNIKVVMPDANGDFTAPIAKGAIDKVQVVDVDMVLQLKDGTALVLAGGAMSAMDASRTEVKFNDGLQGLSNLFDLVGTIAIPKLEPILSSLQGVPDVDGHGGVDNPSNSEASGLSASVTSQIVNQLTQIVQVNAQSVTIKTVDPAAQIAVLSQNTKTGNADQQPLQHVEPPIPPERPGVIPPEHIIGADAPAMKLALVNLTTITQVGNVLYGSGGTPISATDSSNNAQFEPQIINAPADATEIHAISNIPPDNFIKVIDMTLTGNGIAQTILVKGVPDDMSIANGKDLGGGVWSIPVVPGQRDYDIQLEYTTTPADPNAPVHQEFSLEFDVIMTTADGVVELAQVKQFVIKDVHNANDLTYIDPTTGQSVYVLPAQGNSHVIHAGDAGVTIYGSNADDFLFGGAGVDTIHGGTGNTYFEGGGGADQLIGGSIGVNTAGYTQSANGVLVDLLNGTGTGGDAQGDTLTNIQNVIGSANNDTFVSGTGANNINGGGGVDTVSYDGSLTGVTVDLSAGTGQGGNADGDKLTGIQNVTGSTHDDTFFGNSLGNAFDGNGHDLGGADTVSYANITSGAAGVTVDLFHGQGGGAAAGDTYVNIQNIIGTKFDDTFIDGAGANNYTGSGGNDTVDYSNAGAGVRVDFVNNIGSFDIAEGDSYINIQNVIGSNFDDTFVAGLNSKNFTGGAGFDTVDYRGAGSGVIIDTINNVGGGAAAGNTYNSIEAFVGSGSDDTFIASAVANSFSGGSGGSDTVDYSHSDAAVTIDLSQAGGLGTSGGYATGDQFINISNVIGSDHDDVFVASSAHNSFEGGLGNNTVSYAQSTSQDSTGVIVDLSVTDGSGTSGNYAGGDKFSNIQNVIGSVFADTFVASSVANVFTGNGGSDTVSYAKSVSTDAIGVTVDLAAGTGSGDYAEGDIYIGVQNVIGSAYNDTFIASNVANSFTSGGGSDTVSYSASADAVNVDLVNGVGTGGDAEGDRFNGIQNVIGSAQDDVFIDSLAANIIDGGITSLHNRVSYANSVSAPGVAAGVTVDLNLVDGSGNSGGYAAGDKLSNIQDLTGSAADDTFGASAAANNLDGGASTGASHNRVSYLSSVDGGGAAAGVTVDLVHGTGTGGYAQDDTYVNIQDVTGSKADDVIVASSASNSIDGSTGSLHNQVSYAESVTSTGAAAGVTIDLNRADGSGNSGGYAAGDKLTNIQDLLGSLADDTFIASAAANNLDGNTGSLHNRVSYISSNDDSALHTAVGVTVDLANSTGSGGYAQGDHYANIQDVTGSEADDTIIASLAANNLDGRGGSDTVSYANGANTVGVTVDLFSGQGSGAGSFAEGDTYANIENVIGTQLSDTFYANADANSFTGGGGVGVDTVNYSHAPNDGNGVVVDLVNGVGSGGYATGDKYNGIQNAVGTVNDDRFVGNGAANAFTGFGGVDTVDYSTLNGGAVNVDFSTPTGTGSGGLAQGDTYVGIRNAIGGEFDDTFTANTDVNAATSNSFDGGASTGTSHNKVSYAGTGVGVTVNLSDVAVGGVAAGTGGGGAIGDRYTNIQDAFGTTSDDIFVASAASNTLDGNTGSLHNRVDYSASVDAGGVAAGVIVDLSRADGVGTSGGYAQGDKLINIQDVTGSDAADTFYASNAANDFKGGLGSDTVSYERTTAGLGGVTVDLSGGASSGGFAGGDTFTSIENVIGTNSDDTFIDGTGAVSNTYTGLLGSNTVDYSHSNAGVTVDLFNGQGTGGYAQGDIYGGIQNVKGSNSNDTFIDGSGAAADAYVGNGGVDTIDYSHSDGAVQVNFGSGLLTGAIGTGAGAFATNDTYLGVQNVVGSKFDDTFTASTDTTAVSANSFDGGVSTAASHNRVSYAGTGAGVTVNLSDTTANGVLGGTGSGAATGDKYVNIQDVTGTASDDRIIASAATNFIDGGASTNASHNRVDYSQSIVGGVAVGVTVDLRNNVGTGGFAQGDTYANIQDVTGSGADDTFVANGANNNFDGGAGSDTVDYSSSTAIIVNLSGNTVNGLASGNGSGDLAAGDTYTNIENIKGGAGNDLFYAGSTANAFTSGGGTDTVNYSQSANGVMASLLAGANNTGGDAAGDTFNGITNLTGSAQADTLTGLVGGGSTLDGGAGNDSLNGSGVGNTLIGGLGDDTMTTLSGDGNLFIGGAGADKMSGAVGSTNNTADYTSSGAGVIVDLFTGVGSGAGSDAAGDQLSNIQNVKGTTFSDTFVGNDKANTFTGGGGAGIDTVSYFESGASVTASLNVPSGPGGTAGDATGDIYIGITNLTGSAFADNLTGLAGGGSTLTGLAGNDQMTGTGSNNTFVGGLGADNMSATGGTNNRATYIDSAAAVVIDLVTGQGGGVDATSESFGDTLSGIQNLTGSSLDDVFYLNSVSNDVIGGNGMDTVNYSHEAIGTDITINLAAGTATGTGAFGGADALHSIENAVGGAGHDTFIASNDQNFFDGGSGSETDTVSYASNTGIGNNTAGVTIDFTTNTGSGRWAAGDHYAHIENVIGTNGNDTFIDGGGVVNSYNGGANAGGSHDLVSYQFVSTGGALTIGLDGAAGHNTGNSATGNVGDTYTNISDLTGSATLDTTIWGNTGNNILTALGTSNNNTLNGVRGDDTLDARLGGHNTVLAGTSGNTIVESTVSLGGDGVTSVLGANIVSINGSTSNTTLDLHGLSNFLDLSTFRGKVTNITTLDLLDQGDPLADQGSGATHGTQARITTDDINALGVILNGHSYHELTVALNTGAGAGVDSLRLDPLPNQYQVITTTTTSTDYAYFDSTTNQELAVLHVLK